MAPPGNTHARLAVRSGFNGRLLKSGRWNEDTSMSDSSEPKEGSAAHALMCADTLMKATNKKKFAENVYEWNWLMLFLERAKAKESGLTA